MLIVFAIAIFLSAALLFIVQPLVAKLMLPLLGGSPAVWNACMLFFQSLLLAGYAYAHLLTRARSTKAQVAIHAVLVIAAGATLPITLRSSDPEGPPLAWLLGALTLAAGAPFAVLSATGPLLQRWFSRTDHPAAADPYFLYAASNAGSLLGLLAYPLAIEPLLDIKQQSSGWAIAYAVLALFLIGAGVLASRRPATQSTPDVVPTPAADARPRSLTTILWIGLAAAPSSLMLGATSYISTDLAAVPLLWIVPLTIYLLTMIGAFSKFGPTLARAGRWLLIIAAPTAFASIVMRGGGSILFHITVHLTLLLAASMACHGRLAALRPPPDRLTSYFLWISLGGAIGGLFNSLLAPIVFPGIFEYPIAMVAVCWLGLPRKPLPDAKFPPIESLILDALAAGSAGALLLGSSKLAGRMGLKGIENLAIGLIPVAVLLLFLSIRPRRQAGALAVVLFLAVMSAGGQGRPVHTERTFFGVHRVVDEPNRTFRKLLHGTTAHGVQLLDPARANIATTYYHTSGPAAEVFLSMTRSGRLFDAAIVGLGTGAMAAHAQPNQRLHVMEIDPAVISIARNQEFFTFLSACPAKIDYQVGDGRLLIARSPAESFDLILLDAFSSDAIPVHLLTVEAFQTYLSKLRVGGAILVHITNRHLDLTPVLAGAVERLGLAGRHRHDTDLPPEYTREHKAESHWALIGANETALGPFAFDPRWKRFETGKTPWTDGFSNILSVLSKPGAPNQQTP